MIRTVPTSHAVVSYLSKISARESRAQMSCREDTSKLPNAGMQIGADQGAVMAIILRLMGAKRYLEIGTFTGYSALTAAQVLPEKGRVVAIDVSAEYTNRARRYWKMAGVEEKIDLRLGAATDVLEAMITNAEPPFDFIFIDADKINYDVYYERALTLLRTGGLIALDNMLWSGTVADETNRDSDTVALRTLSRKIHEDDRVEMALAALGDGLMLALKK